jgi:hypothetical protein
MSVDQFIDAVRTGGIWDYKNSSLFDGFSDRSLLAEFGNFHFGLVAHAAGFPLGITIAGAGTYQVFFQHHDISNVLNFAGSTLIFGLPYALCNAFAATMYGSFGVRFGDNVDDTPAIVSGYEAYGN